MPTFPPTQLPKKQQGSVLLIGMIFLVVLMVGATSIMNSAVQDERITGNTKTSLQAFFAAEAGYREMVEHLGATDEGGDESVKEDRWDAIDSQVSAYSTQNDWEQADIDNKVSGFSAKAFTGQDKGASKFTVKFSPVFDDDGNRINNKILFFSEGMAGRASRTIGFELEGGGNSGVTAPAAISCFGGPCALTAGAAANSKNVNSQINGRNHKCTPSGCEDLPASSGDEAFSVPSVYLSDFEKSSLDIQGKGDDKKKDPPKPYIGQDKYYKDNDEPQTYHSAATGKDTEGTDRGPVWSLSDFPSDNQPTDDKYIGDSDDALINQLLNKAGSEFGTFSDPKITLTDPDSKQLDEKSAAGVLIVDRNGQEYKAAGGGTFFGLVVIKGCTQWSQRGSFTIYGAVIVDSSGCGEDYTPFVGKGGPDVKYSSDALTSAGVGSGGGFNGNITDWYEVTGN